MTKLLIIRHGNTFGPDEEPRRVGCRTDIPLVTSGIEQAKALGGYIKDHDLIPDYICASELQRAQETACIMMCTAGRHVDIATNKNFNEIDHGPDENKTEFEIVERLGQEALDDWNEFGVVPEGWKACPRTIQNAWIEFAEDCLQQREGKISCIVSSGGIIRFAPILLQDNYLPESQPAKAKTGSLSVFSYVNGQWQCDHWNRRP